MRKTLGTDAVLREALRSVDRRIGLALVYGPVAAGSDRINIDLMIVGDDVDLGE